MPDITVTRYHPLLRTLHWLVALLVILQLAVGAFALAELPNTTAKIIPLTGHVAVGLAVGALMVLRLVVRLATPRPPPAGTGNVAFDWLRRMTHFLFYAVVLAMISTGVGLALMSDLFPILFGPGGQLPPDFAAFEPRRGHEVFATVLFVLLTLHVAGVLYHQFVLRDRLLDRMTLLPRKDRSGASGTTP